MEEVWKAIDGTNGQYFVSNLGRVKSKIILKGGIVKSNILKQQDDNKGYKRIRVTVCRKKMSFKVHREVAKAFIPNPDNKPQVNHINGDKTDNRAENLEWATNKENAYHAIENGLWGNVFKASKETNEKRMKPVIIQNLGTGEKEYFKSSNDASRKYGICNIKQLIEENNGILLRKNIRIYYPAYC